MRMIRRRIVPALALVASIAGPGSAWAASDPPRTGLETSKARITQVEERLAAFPQETAQAQAFAAAAQKALEIARKLQNSRDVARAQFHAGLADRLLAAGERWNARARAAHQAAGVQP